MSGTAAIAGRMLRSGIVQRTVDLSESSSSSLEQTWLVVQCADKAGLLAEIAQLITAHAHNIKVRCGRRDCASLLAQ